MPEPATSSSDEPVHRAPTPLVGERAFNEAGWYPFPILASAAAHVKPSPRSCGCGRPGAQPFRERIGLALSGGARVARRRVASCHAAQRSRTARSPPRTWTRRRNHAGLGRGHDGGLLAARGGGRTRCRADRAVDGSFDLLGHPGVSFGGRSVAPRSDSRIRAPTALEPDLISIRRRSATTSCCGGEPPSALRRRPGVRRSRYQCAGGVAALLSWMPRQSATPGNCCDWRAVSRSRIAASRGCRRRSSSRKLHS